MALFATTRDSPEPGAGDDAAADASHQAAAALQSRSGRLCRGRARAQPAARARRATTTARRRRDGAESRPTAQRERREAARDGDWMGAETGDQPQLRSRSGLGTELDNVFPDDGGETAAHGRGAAAGLFRMGRASAPAARGRRLQSRSLRRRPRPRSPIISPSSWRWRSPIRCSA